MSITATRTQKSVGGISSSSSKVFTGDVREVHSYSVATAETDQERALTIDITELQYFMIKNNTP